MPNRILNEKIRTSKSVNQLSDFQFRLWAYLLTYVDDYGRGSADTELLKGFVFPRRAVREQDIQSGLEALERTGSIQLYTVAGEPYFCFPNWAMYQRIQSKVSKFPEPPVNDSLPQKTVSHGDSLCSTVSHGDSLCSTVSHGDSLCSTVSHGDSLLESRIQNPESNPNPKECAHARRARGQYGWVKLSDDEYSRLIADLGEAEAARCIAYVDESAQGTGNKNRWKDWNLVVRKCSREGWGLDSKRSNSTRSASAPKDYTCLNASLSQLDKLIDEI